MVVPGSTPSIIFSVFKFLSTVIAKLRINTDSFLFLNFETSY